MNSPETGVNTIPFWHVQTYACLKCKACPANKLILCYSETDMLLLTLNSMWRKYWATTLGIVTFCGQKGTRAGEWGLFSSLVQIHPGEASARGRNLASATSHAYYKGNTGLDFIHRLRRDGTPNSNYGIPWQRNPSSPSSMLLWSAFFFLASPQYCDAFVHLQKFPWLFSSLSQTFFALKFWNHCCKAWLAAVWGGTFKFSGPYGSHFP